MAALAADDGTNSFLAFLTAAQEEDSGEELKEQPTSTKQLNAEANLLAQLTNDTHMKAAPSKKTAGTKAGVGAAAAKPMRRSPKSSQSWQPDQDEVLRKAVAENGGRNWKQIASSVPGKSPTQCLHRWQRVLNPNVVKGPWKHAEDERLKELVEKIGSKHWSRIATEMQGRNGKQCRERWINHLKPDILKDPWSRQEEEVLLRAYAEIGSKWAEMEKILPGRTENAIKNHWHSTLRKSRTIEDYAQNEQSRMAKRKRPAVEKHDAKGVAVDTKGSLRIDTDNLKADGAGARTDGTSPVFSPARVGSPENSQSDKESRLATAAAARTAVKTNPPDDLVTPTNETVQTPHSTDYVAGDILAVRDDNTPFLLCRVVDSEKGTNGALRVTWYDRESAGDFTAGAKDNPASATSNRPKGRDSPLIAGETLGLFRGGPAELAETIGLDSVILKLKTVPAASLSAEEARLTLTADDCAKLEKIASAAPGADSAPPSKRQRGVQA